MALGKITFSDLMAFVCGGLDPDRRELVKQQLASAPEQARRAERIRSIVNAMRTDDSVAPSADAVAKAKAYFNASARSAVQRWWEGLSRVAAELMFDSRMQPALAGFRGTSDSFQLSYECEGVAVDLQCRPETEEAETSWAIVGQVDEDGVAHATDVALVPHGQGAPLTCATPDEAGVFTIATVSAGTYDLLIRINGEVLELSGIQVQ